MQKASSEACPYRIQIQVPGTQDEGLEPMTDSPHGRPILDIIREIVGDLTRIDTARVVPEARWEDVLPDRFDFYGLLSDTQKRFGIEIPDDDAFDMETFGDLIAFVRARGIPE
jgi:acyl carrier protein